MRVQFCAVTLLVLSLLTGVASAQESMRVSPSTLRPGDEAFLTIHVTGLSYDNVVTVSFDGPAGQFTLDPSYIDGSQVIAYVPLEIMVTEGRYSVDVYVQRGELTQRYGPGFFNVEVPQEEPFFITVPEQLIVEATSLQGEKVHFTAQANDGSPATCSPASGSTFPFGATTVHCTATNGVQTATASFPVTVVDTIEPTISVPDPIVSDSPVVHYTVTATDALDPSPMIFCSPASGSTFPGGQTLVRCYAADHNFNYAFASFTVTITGGPPALSMPAEVDVEAETAAGSQVEYVVTANEGGVVSCSPASGTVFPVGVTTVNCSATNVNGSTTGSFLVGVYDRTAPVITVPADFTVSASSNAGAVVTFVTSAFDTVDSTPTVHCTPASGATFPLGTTLVECFAVDDVGNMDLGDFKVTVVNNPPPVLTVPANITREATGPGGATVTYTATATNNGVVVCNPASGSLFPLGATTVSCTATNGGGSSTKTFKVTIVDTTAPTLTVPGDITAEATSPAGATVNYVTSATDIVDGNVAVNCTPISGSTFGLGTTTVQCSAADTRSNSTSGSFKVNVVDTTAPVIILVKPSLATLWPPDHKMVPISVTVVAIDAVDLTPTSVIVSVTSNQPDNGTGDGDTSNDWEITGPLTVELRSERSGQQDRIYTITVQTTDDSGNSSTATTTVRVTQSRRR